jgi:hypothetical protein
MHDPTDMPISPSDMPPMAQLDPLIYANRHMAQSDPSIGQVAYGANGSKLIYVRRPAAHFDPSIDASRLVVHIDPLINHNSPIGDILRYKQRIQVH